MISLSKYFSCVRGGIGLEGIKVLIFWEMCWSCVPPVAFALRVYSLFFTQFPEICSFRWLSLYISTLTFIYVYYSMFFVISMFCFTFLQLPLIMYPIPWSCVPPVAFGTY